MLNYGAKLRIKNGKVLSFQYKVVTLHRKFGDSDAFEVVLLL